MKTKLAGLLAIVSVATCLLAGCVAVPKTKIKGSIAGQPFYVSSPKNTELRNLEVSATSNGVVTIKIESMSTKMDPEVIQTTAAGQAAMLAQIAAMTTNLAAAAVGAAVSAAK